MTDAPTQADGLGAGQATRLVSSAPTLDELRQSPKIPSTQRIYDAVCELHALEQVATRETVAELTGLKLTVVDDRLRALMDDEKIKRVLRGVFLPVERHPPARSMSKTLLPDGMVKIEIGDQVLELTPREDRMLAQLQSGAATQAAAIESSRAMAIRSTEMGLVLERLERVTRSVFDGSGALNERGEPCQAR
ncbi:hypothetical protein [Alicycliphilus denitrificans]|uniref:hypothetical protein n=1 Tax=Alicycliphilus denitrificans TaxID=179636 RepID=UPI00384BDFB5